MGLKQRLGKHKFTLMITILVVALFHMPANALSPSTNTIATVVFPQYQLSQIQTTMQLANFVSPIVAIIMSFFTNRGYLSKKNVIVIGLIILALDALCAVLMHTQYWHLVVMCALLGVATGMFVTNAFGILFDLFNDDERNEISGYQTSCVNLGGILMSVVGGLLATRLWYGGWMILFVGVPVAVLVQLTVPSVKQPRAKTGEARKRMDPWVYYYSAAIFLFMMTYVTGGSNISTHLAASNLGNSGTAGIATAIQMGGGVVCGIFFGKLSGKFRDLTMSFAFAVIFIGFMLLSLFPASLPVTFIAVFIVGTSMSLMMPRAVFAVSQLVDSSNSGTATAFVTSIAPSFGGFMSPVVFTNLTTALGGESTVFRYRFVGFCALAFSVILFLLTKYRDKKGLSLPL